MVGVTAIQDRESPTKITSRGSKTRRGRVVCTAYGVRLAMAVDAVVLVEVMA
jgi:hypothetical protein